MKSRWETDVDIHYGSYFGLCGGSGGGGSVVFQIIFVQGGFWGGFGLFTLDDDFVVQGVVKAVVRVAWGFEWQDACHVAFKCMLV